MITLKRIKIYLKNQIFHCVKCVHRDNVGAILISSVKSEWRGVGVVVVTIGAGQLPMDVGPQMQFFNIWAFQHAQLLWVFLHASLSPSESF